jgi:hypothetical protein
MRTLIGCPVAALCASCSFLARLSRKRDAGHKDASGAVLPGVTIEARPALIEDAKRREL